MPGLWTSVTGPHHRNEDLSGLVDPLHYCHLVADIGPLFVGYNGSTRIWVPAAAAHCHISFKHLLFVVLKSTVTLASSPVSSSLFHE